MFPSEKAKFKVEDRVRIVTTDVYNGVAGVVKSKMKSSVEGRWMYHVKHEPDGLKILYFEDELERHDG